MTALRPFVSFDAPLRVRLTIDTGALSPASSVSLSPISPVSCISLVSDALSPASTHTTPSPESDCELTLGASFNARVSNTDDIDDDNDDDDNNNENDDGDSNKDKDQDKDEKKYGDTESPARTRAWTGPIRAIVPLPRRAHCQFSNAGPIPVLLAHGTSTVVASTRLASAVTRVIPDSDVEAEDVWLDGDNDEDEDEDSGVEKRRCSSFQSITAAQGLGAYSFEELRLECYAQSLVARGTTPLPVTQPSLAIPPAFIPRRVPRR